MALYQELQVFAADDTAVAWTFSTDPAATFPYLQPPSSWSDTRISPLEGTSVIGEQRMGILDRRITLSDQATGKLTSIISDANGEFQLYNRRALWRQQDGVGGWDSLFDGVVGDLDLKDSLVAFAFPLRDIRERERKTKAFTQARDTVILPSSLTLPYGVSPSVTLVTPAVLTGGTVVSDTTALDVRIATFVGAAYDQTPQDRWDGLAEAFFRARPVFDVTSGETVHRFADVAVRWRLTSGGAWTTLENMRAYVDPAQADFSRSVVAARGRVTTATRRVEVYLQTVSGTLPSPSDVVDIQILSRKAPTEDVPFVYEGTFGDLAKKLYDGEFSARNVDGSIRPTGIRYDATKYTGGAALAEMGQPCRVILTKPVDDLRDWTHKNIYLPTNTAPAIIGGLITPVRCALPDAATAIIALTSANVSAEGWSWGMKGSDAINKVVVKYKRDFRATRPVATGGISGFGVTLGAVAPYTRWAGRNEPKTYGGMIKPEHHTDFDLLASSDVEVQHIDAPSATAIHDKEFVIEADTIRDIGTWDANNVWLPADAEGDLGMRIAQRLSAETVRRFRYGAMPITVKARRGDAAVKAAKLGDWARVTLSWMPNLATHLRGIDELAQVVRIHIINAAWQEMELVSAGPYANALATPTLTSVTEAAGALTVTFATLAAGAAGVVYTAINATIPAADSPLWLYAGETDGAGGLVAVTPRFASGDVVWVRVRAEAKGRRSSAWAIYGAPTAITVTIEPRILSASVEVSAEGAWTVRWVANPDTLGVRVRYSVADAAGVVTAITTWGEYDVADGEATGSTILHGHTVEVTVIPFPGYAAGAVTGSAGPSYVVQRASRPAIEPAAPTVDVTVIAGTLLSKTFRITATSYFGSPEIRYRIDGPFSSGTWSAWTATNPYDVVVPRLRSLSGSLVVEVRDANQLTTEIVYSVSAEKPALDNDTGQITEAIPTSEGHVLARGFMEGTGQNGATVDLTAGGFNSPPRVDIWGGVSHEPRNASFSGGYNAALPQEMVRRAQNVTEADFDIEATQVQRGTPTAQLANFPASNLMTNVADDEELVTNPAPSNDNLYTVRYTVSVTTNHDAPGGESASATVVVAIEADVGGWTEYASFPYTRAHPLSGTTSWLSEVKQISVTGMTNASKIRLLIKSFVDTDTLLRSTFTVHGKEAADATDGASWTTATDSVATATPLVGTAQIVVNWRAQEVSL